MNDWQLVSSFGALLATVLGGIIARDRQLVALIHTRTDDVDKARVEGDDKLHDRLNRTKDDANNCFVKKSDLEGHIGRLERMVGEMRQDMKDERRETNRRLDAVIAALKPGE